MSENQTVVILKKDLVLSKEGFADLVYEAGLLLKVEMQSNDHVVVKSDEGRTFILREEEQGIQWDFL